MERKYTEKSHTGKEKICQESIESPAMKIILSIIAGNATMLFGCNVVRWL